MAPRRGFIVIVLLLLFLAPLVFFDTTRSFAQAPYPPTSTPTSDPTQCEPANGTCYSLSFVCSDWGMSLNPGKICPVGQKCCSGSTPAPTPLPSFTPIGGSCIGNGSQGQVCSQTTQCTGCGAGISYTCQGYVPPGPPGGACGHCYCTDPSPTAGTCGPWEGCGWENPPGAWCETRRCDNGCECSDTNPSCCAYQIQCPCTEPTGVGGTVAPTNTAGAPPPPSNTPPNTPTVTPGCSQLYRCRQSDYSCLLTAETFDNITKFNCPGNTYSCDLAYGTCYQTQGACQAVCATPTPTPANTATPGPSSTPTNTPPSVPLYCTIKGNKYIVDIAGPVGLCDEVAESCVPAADNSITLDDMHPVLPNIGTDSTNPYEFTNMDADSNNPAYRVKPDIATLTGFSTAYVYNLTGAPASADHFDFSCPVVPPQTTTTKTIDWYYTPPLGTIRVEAKKTDTVTCTGVDGFGERLSRCTESHLQTRRYLSVSIAISHQLLAKS